MDEETVLKPSNNYSNFLEKSQSLETRENNESLDDLLLGSEAEAADGVNGDDTSPVVVPYTDESDSDISDDEKAESPWEDDAQKQADGTLANLLETVRIRPTSAEKKSIITGETEAVMEDLCKQGVPTQYIKLLRELYRNSTTRVSPFYMDIITDVKRGARQGGTPVGSLS